ncbi:MAG: tRNA-specific adenosine deaminase [Planctomycetes bacterium]|nr:tRNA-specific adenosine deaminase [Planctomycetota bacterium]
MQPRAEAASAEASPEDREFMEFALKEARAAFRADEVPIGAVVVAGGSAPSRSGEPRILACAHNLTRTHADPTAHAEILALRAAARVRGYERLEGCTVYATVEPCFMCSGALILARVERVCFGVRDPKFGGACSLGSVLDHPGLNHRVPFIEGVGAEEAGQLMREFFRKKRRTKDPAEKERCQSG